MPVENSEHEQSASRDSKRKRWASPLVILSDIEDTAHSGVSPPGDSAPHVTFNFTS